MTITCGIIDNNKTLNGLNPNSIQHYPVLDECMGMNVGAISGSMFIHPLNANIAQLHENLALSSTWQGLLIILLITILMGFFP